MALNGIAGHPLPCGRLVESVFDDLEAGVLDDHELNCEHCGTARRSLEALMAATRALLDDDSVPPPGLVDRIMQTVRAELRRGNVLTIPSEFGPARVSENAVAVVLRYAADTVVGVRARSCRIKPHATAEGALHVQMSLALQYGAGPAEDLLNQVRRRVYAALTGQVGLVAEAVDLKVADLWPDDLS